jgi:hypothetical protein
MHILFFLIVNIQVQNFDLNFKLIFFLEKNIITIIKAQTIQYSKIYNFHFDFH